MLYAICYMISIGVLRRRRRAGLRRRGLEEGSGEAREGVCVGKKENYYYYHTYHTTTILIILLLSTIIILIGGQKGEGCAVCGAPPGRCHVIELL
jgi:uncharacterized protein YjlB